MDTLKSYYYLTKPGIIRGNLMVVSAGFLLASKGHVRFGLLTALLLGTSLVIAAGCVLNNYIDRRIDSKMTRTQGRALVTGRVSAQSALVYAVILGILGFAVLVGYTNLLTAGVGLVGLVFYVVLYGIYKRRSPIGTVVGSVAGATPPVAGYCAVTGTFDLAALLLFLALIFWQMPHFYAIAMYRHNEYKAAGLPVLPLKKGFQITQQYVLYYIVLFILATLSLTFWGYTGYVYAIAMALVGIGWLVLGIRGFKTNDHVRWARDMFRFSLLVIVVFSVMLSINVWV